jgi:hypothetical protein
LLAVAMNRSVPEARYSNNPSGSIGFYDNYLVNDVPEYDMKLMHTKKAWHFFAFIGYSEVLDYLNLPNYNE